MSQTVYVVVVKWPQKECVDNCFRLWSPSLHVSRPCFPRHLPKRSQRVEIYPDRPTARRVLNSSPAAGMVGPSRRVRGDARHSPMQCAVHRNTMHVHPAMPVRRKESNHHGRMRWYAYRQPMLKMHRSARQKKSVRMGHQY